MDSPENKKSLRKLSSTGYEINLNYIVNFGFVTHVTQTL